MNRKSTTPEELLQRMLEPFPPHEEEWPALLDAELERTLAMTPAEIRADLEAMGYDVPALQREAREFLGRMGWRPRPRIHGRLLSVAAPVLVLTTLAGAATGVTLPLAAHAPIDPPAVTAAAPPAHPLVDGGSNDARSR